MAELMSIGLDVGTTTTQMILSRLTVRNAAPGSSVPRMEIVSREVLYESPIHFTPLTADRQIDEAALEELLRQEYRRAGIRPEQIDTGAVIVTGETSRAENARTVLNVLAEQAGKFVVTTAGPDLESCLAAKGAGALPYSMTRKEAVLHMDIGGGTSNLALIRSGKILRTGCMNIGGRLIKLDPQGKLTYVSPVLKDLFPWKPGQTPEPAALQRLSRLLAQALEMAAGLRTPDETFGKLLTREAAPWQIPREPVSLSFSGGVADCIGRDLPPLTYGDLGPALGSAIRGSRLCQGQYRLESRAIRATVIGAGCHSTQLSGSTVFMQNVPLPLKNLPLIREGQHREGECILALPPMQDPGIREIRTLADRLAAQPRRHMYLLLEQDCAKALGQALAARLPQDSSILCLDGLRADEDSYLDVGNPVGPAVPVAIKTLVFER